MPIRVLDAAVVGRIAAGEVVERPSSVVKELMENSMDAGATSITVEIKGGGIDYLRVTDNGCGIEPNQVRLAFENHATSKLQNAEQLDDIRTLGFRGEALPSIASVSHVEMRTRTRGADSGVQLNVDGGRDLRVAEAACPDGTTIIMRDLFFNIPVRRSFLKKPSYEGGLVSDVVARMLIGNPKIAVRFINNGHTTYHSYGDGNLKHAVFAVYGKETAAKMTEVDACEGGTRIYGLIGTGELAKPTRAHQLFFINGRSVRCNMISRALETVCRSRVMVGTYPMCALNLVLPPNAVDVNVHPNKLEVRFRDEMTTQMTIESLLQSAFTGETVLSFARDTAPEKTIQRTVVQREVVPIRHEETPLNPEQLSMLNTLLAKEKARIEQSMPTQKGRLCERVTELPSPIVPPVSVRPPQPASDTRKDVPSMPPLSTPSPEAAAPDKAAAGPDIPAKTAPDPVVTAPSAAQMPPLPTQRPVSEPAQTEKDALSYRIVGVAFKTYIILEVGETLLLIDQHAAHERLRYEMYTRQLEEGTGSQQLLITQVLRVSAREMALIKDNLDVLEEAGYTIEPFGDADIRVRAVPFILGKAELRPIFMDMLGCLSRLRQATRDERRAQVMQMSCKSAIKGGDMLTDSEIRTLITQMLETNAPPTCPHGRPVVKKVEKRDLEKLFKRIQ